MKSSSRRTAPNDLRRLLSPLLNLLDLVRARRFEPRDIVVAPFAHHFNRYVQLSPSLDLNDLGEFAAAASQLLLLKSQELTPWKAASEDDIDLENASDRLGDSLSPFTSGIDALASRLTRSLESFARNDYVPPHPRQMEIIPLSADTLGRAMISQVAAMERRGLRHVPGPLFLRMEIAIRSLRRSLNRLRSISFTNLVRDTQLDRPTSVVYFLAILDLARRQEVDIRQDEPFADIEVLVRRRRGSRRQGDSTRERKAG